MKKVVISGLLMTSIAAHAGTVVQKTVCPSVSDEAQNILTNIETLRSQLKKGPACEPIAEKISLINDTLTNEHWKQFKDIVTGKDSEALEGDQIEELGSLANSVSQTLMQTIDLVKGSKCIDEANKPSFLSTLSGVTKEVSAVVGNMTGPYGMAISLGGSILAEAIDGIDAFFQGKNPYNFNNPDEELLFTNQFCAFTEAQKDVTDYLSIDKREEELGLLKKYLLKKQSDLVEKCAECEAYDIAAKAKKKADILIKSMNADLDIQNNPAVITEVTTYSRCSEIARAVHTQSSDLKKLYQLLGAYENPMMSESDKELIDMMVEGSKYLPEVYPNYNDCISMKPAEKVEISKSFNDFMRDDVIHLQETIFMQQMNVYQFKANKRYVKPLGDYIAKTDDRLKWIEKHSKEVQAKLKKFRSSDNSKIRELNNKLEDRMLYQLMPSYLNFSIKRNQSNIKAFAKNFKKFRKRSLKSYSKKLQKNMSSIKVLTTELKTTKSVDARVFLSELRQVMDTLYLSLDQADVIRKYCDYLAFTTNSVGKINSYCSQSINNLAAQFKSLEYYKEDIDVLQSFDNWAEVSLDIQSSRVKDYADHIRDWTDQGDSRWQRQTPVKVPESFEERIEEETKKWNEDVSKFDEK
jgi:hypothetical protein